MFIPRQPGSWPQGILHESHDHTQLGEYHSHPPRAASSNRTSLWILQWHLTQAADGIVAPALTGQSWPTAPQKLKATSSQDCTLPGVGAELFLSLGLGMAGGGNSALFVFSSYLLSLCFLCKISLTLKNCS